MASKTPARRTPGRVPTATGPKAEPGPNVAASAKDKPSRRTAPDAAAPAAPSKVKPKSARSKAEPATAPRKASSSKTVAQPPASEAKPKRGKPTGGAGLTVANGGRKAPARNIRHAKGVVSGKGTPKSPYNPDRHPEVARQLTLLGCTQKEIAEEFGIDPDTLTRWRARHPELESAIQRGGRLADGQVVGSLFKAACGYERPEVKVFQPKVIERRDPKTGQTSVQVVPVNSPFNAYYPPDVRAAQYFLNNRRARPETGALPWRASVDPDSVAPTPVTLQIVFDPNVKPDTP